MAAIAAIAVMSARGAPTAAPDNAVQFDGVNDYVTFGQATSTLGASQLTLETWFMRTGTGVGTGTGTGGLTSAVPLVTKGRAQAETPANLNMNYFLGIDTATNKLAVDFEDTANGGNHPRISVGTAITNNVWHHAAATYDGTTWRIYLDGKLDDTLVVGAFTPESTSIQHAALATAMDSTGAPAGFFQGVLDEARIWNVARTYEQIRQDRNTETPSSTTGLLGYWHLDDGAPFATATDSSGHGVTGTLTNGPTWVGGYTFPADAAPAAPQGVSAVARNAAVDLTWTANSETDLVGYNVYRGTAPGVSTSGTPLNGDTPLASPSYTDATAVNGQIYYYAVTAVDTFNNKAATEVSATPSATLTALRFDGSNDYVTFGPATSTLGAMTFTLETWFKRTGAGVGTSTGNGGLASAIPLVTKGRAEQETPANLNMNYFLGIDMATNRLAVDFEDTSTGLNHPLIANTAITTGVWHHAAATYDGTTWNIYLDGQPDGTLNVGAFTPESTSIQHAGLGTAMTSTGAAAGFFAGVLDEARIWNVARSQSQIQSTMGQEVTSRAGLIGRWGLNDGSGTTAVNSIGGSPNGTLTNGPAWVVGYPLVVDPPPAAPQNLQATAGDNQVSLTWDPNSEPDLAGYNVFRSTASPISTGGPPLNGSLLTSPAYVDTTAVNGQTYYYVLVAVDNATNVSGPSNEVNATPSAPGPHALQFDGSNDHVTFGPATNTLGATTFTLETWFRRSGTGVGTGTGNGGIASAIPLITKGRAEMETPPNLNMNYFLGIDASSGVLVADFEDTAGGVNHPVSGQTAIAADNSWHHAAASYDGTTWRLYLDGKLDAKLVVGNFTPESTSIQHAALATAMDSSGTPAGFFAGQLDEARIWSVARTGAQLRANKDSEAPSPASGLLGQWHLDDGAPATTATDSSGHGVTGTLTNGPTWVSGYGFPQDTAAPANPTGLGATPADAQVALAWNANAEPDLAGYNLYRSQSSPVDTNGTPVNGTDLITSSAYTDTGLTNGQTYYYALVAVDGANNASGPSNEASAMPQAAVADPVFVGAGDIADCTRPQDTATGDLIEAIPGSVFTIGDNAYQNGLASEFDCYDAAWGAFKSRTRPTLGNHDFGNGTNPGAPDYFDYFNGSGQSNGPAGTRPDGYYSYDISGNGATWHVVVLNSECEPSTGYWLPGGCAAGSAQEQWLRSDLASASTNNIIAMWHKPRFSSTGNHSHMAALYQALYDYGADIVMGGHWHNYERLAPMDPAGNLDTSFGVRNFVVGTGGAALTGFGTPLATSEVRDSSTYGVMKFTLHSNSYDWQFIPIAGQTFTDSGTGTVHGAPPDTTAPSVTIVSAVPSTLGPSDSSTDVTWHADENGSYSVRVGGTDCSTGTQVASGSYSTAPADVVTTINATDLAEGPNTVRICVTDAATNTGSSTTGVTKNTVPHANALQFDGSNDYVTFGQATSTLGATQFTLETWFRRSGAGVGTSTGTGGIASAVPLITKGRAEQDSPPNLNMNYFLGIDASSGVLVADFEDDAGGNNHPVSGTTQISPDNTWHHAAVTYDGGTWRLYLDGKLEKKQAESGTPEDTSIQHASLGSALTSAAVEAPAGFFAGQLDEARIWNVARTGAQIRANKDTEAPTPMSGLLGQWHLDEGAPSSTIGDSSGHNVTGTLTNGPAWVTGYGFPQDASAPANPTGLVATPADAQNALVWNANAESDLAGYNLYRDTSSPVSTSSTPVNGTDLITSSAYTDTGLTNGQTYYYALVAVDGANNASGASGEASATPQAGDPVLVGAGDIADCSRTQDTATATLVSGISGQVFTIGDNVYQNGTAAEFANCYDPTWGAFKNRTRPALGNHDFGNGTNPGAPNYFDYFNGSGQNNGPAGPRPDGYYSYDISGNGATWHVVVLNSECEPSTGFWLPGGCAAGSAQEQWLRSDLAGASTNNIIAIWHKPRFSSTASYPHMQALWQALYDGGVDIALAGHEHNYERFTPMNAAGTADATYGIRAFTVGTGGAPLSSTSSFLPTSQVFNGSTYGVMKFTLHASSYDWQFIPIGGQSFTDSGTASVHGAPPDTTAPTVTIVSTVPNPLQPSDTSTDLAWHADENGSYSVRVGGSDCATGTQVASGSYSTAPANVVTTIPAASLAVGSNTARVCVTDATTNTGSSTTSVTKNAAGPPATVTFRSAASAANNAGSTLALPLPAGVLSGDLLLAQVTVNLNTGLSAPAGWTLIRSDVNSNFVRQSLYYHLAGASEPASYSWTLGAAHGAVGAMLAYSGVDPVNPIDVSNGGIGSGSTALTAPFLTTTVANDMLVGLYGVKGPVTFTPPAAMTERTEISLGLSGEKVSAESADLLLGAVGSSGNRTATLSVAANGVGQLVALKPGGGGGGGPGPNPPVVDSVVINQSSPTTNQVLTATVTSHDPDPGDVVTYSYQWKKNGSTVGTGATLDLSVSGNGDKGDSITLQVTASDGAHTSAPVTSAGVTVVNSPPSATVALNTSSPTTNQVLTATATKADADATDTVTLTYVWKKNGAIMQTVGPTTSLTDTYDLSVSGNGDPGDTVTVEVTPNDGTVSGSLVSTSATVSATVLPTVTIVSALPSTVGASGSTNVTWHATANGTYSVRVSGTDCATGTQVASGSYTTSPANIVANVLASSLSSEGANTIRVCVTDVQSNTGSDSTVVTKDSISPTVAIVSVVPPVVGASGSTDITWNADESGTYSVRVGGTTCSNGTQVVSGSYAASGNQVTNILVSQLAEGANTVRVCVTDAAANVGSDTSTVTKDSTAPLVTIVSTVPNPLQPSDTSTDLAWHADENGSYSVRVGGSDCATGTQVASGSYSTAPANVVTTIPAASLAVGSNTARVCVTDATTNTGSSTTSVTKNAAGPPATVTFRSAASAANNAGSTLALPLPAGVLSGDLLLAQVTVNLNTGLSAPAGWTLIRSDVNSNFVRQSLYYHLAGASEPASYSWTLGAAHGAVGAMLAYSGVDPVNPIDVSNGGIGSGSTALTAPFLTTTVANDMLVGLYGVKGPVTFTPPAAMTERTEISLGLSGEKVSAESADLLLGAVGSSGNRTATLSVAANGVGQLVALKPGGGGGGGPGPNPPVVDSVVINQSSPTTNQVLTATVTSHDPDPGDVVTYSYQWKKNGSTVGTGATLDLSVSGNGDKGDSITLQVTASDGAHTSAPVTSAGVTVVNSPPSATVALNTSSPTTNQVLTATATKADADATDTVTLTYVWKKNGAIMQTVGPTTSLTDTYDLSVSGNGDPGDTVTVEVTPNDGTVSGSLVSTSATVVTPSSGITFRSAASAANNAGSTLALPLPAGVLSGDLLLAQVTVNLNTGLSAPAGWTLIRSDVNSNFVRQSLYYHLAGASEPASYSWTLGAAHGAVGAMLAYSGVDPVNPIDVSNGGIGSGSTALTAPFLTTTVANDMLVGLYGVKGPVTFTPPAAMTERTEISLGLSGEKVSAESADLLLGAVGSSGNRTATLSVAANGVGQLVALKPAP